MKKSLLVVLAAMFVVVLSQAQTTILDFETAASSTTFQYFGSPIDGSLTETIANPNPAGINTSATVLKYVKPAVAETWAGAFSSPNPTTAIDLSNGGQICVKVHMNHIGNLAVKLEGSTSGQPNWIIKVPNTKVNEWEELCFDASVPSIETPFAPASGIYTRLVIFYDFGTSGTGSEVVSYMDDVVVKASTAPQLRTVSFKVDMNNYTANFDNVYVSGTFNNWSGNANPLTDANLDGIWEGNIDMFNGLYEYKITLDNWAAQEQFGGYEECTKTDPSGQFVNRALSVGGNTNVPKFCFNSCYACGDEVKIKFMIGMGSTTPSPDGVWLCGGGNFDVPGGKYKLKDPDGDGVLELTVPRKKSFSSFYAFANGACPDFSCKENLEGQSCANPANFNDRFLPSVSADTTIATCYQTCYTNAACVSAVKDLIEDVNLFSISGNPSVDGRSVILFSNNATDEKEMLVINTFGQTVSAHYLSAEAAQFELNTENYQPGIYFVTVRSGDRFLTKKLVK